MAVVLIVLAIVIARFPLPAMGQATQRASRETRRDLSQVRMPFDNAD